MVKARGKTKSNFERSSLNPLGHYFREINKFPHLNSKQEVALSERIQSGVGVMGGLKERFAHFVADKDRQFAKDEFHINAIPTYLNRILEKRIEDGIKENAGWTSGVSDDEKAAILYGVDAKDELVNANLRLVVNIATKKQRPGVELWDLIQAGNEHLINAAKKFRPADDNYIGRGEDGGYIRFSTYAHPAIKRGMMRDVIYPSRGVISIPEDVIFALDEIRRAPGELADNLSSSPMTDWRLKRATAVSGVLSLNNTVGSDDGSSSTTWAQLLEDPSANPPSTHAAHSDEVSILYEALGALSERERGVVMRRFRLGYSGDATFGEIACKIGGVARQTAFKIEKRAIDNLRFKIQEIKRCRIEAPQSLLSLDAD